MSSHRIIQGDCIEGLRTLPDASVHCCVTNPPYWGLRDYGHDGQIGLEATPEAYVARMVEVFREVRRVLRDDGTCWVNLGDSYFGTGRGPTHPTGFHGGDNGTSFPTKGVYSHSTLKGKDLCGIPWRVAFALQADGWWLRQDIIWHKPNPMPESVRDRCTKAHEYVFLLTKSDRYYYDAEAVSEAAAESSLARVAQPTLATQRGSDRVPGKTNGPMKAVLSGTTRNRRSVWTVTTKPYSGAHFAVMPADLVEPCIKAGCPEGGTVLDPFAGSGTTLAVAAELGRNAIGCELNPAYIELAEKRIKESRAGVALFEGGAA
jgi:DNA modification methylase